MSTKNYKVHENGRPTRYSQTQIQRELRTCYERGISETATSTNLGFNIKTVCKYFKKWSEEEQEIEREELLQRHKTERKQIVLAYDNLLVDTHRFISNIDRLTESTISKNDTIPRHLLTLRLDLMRFVKDLIGEKRNLKLSVDSVRNRKDELKTILANEVSEDRIQKIVTYLIFNDEKDVRYTQKKLLYEIIKFEKCDETQANIVYEKMVQIGLENCIVGTDSEVPFAEIYGIVPFGLMRGFVTRNELLRYYNKKSKNVSVDKIAKETTN
ncbi:MAG: hypothetical protein ACREA3_02495 [Nitrosotalea sp.]